VYQSAAPTVDERVRVARAIDVLRRPVYSPGTAFIRSILPGFGQLYTGRPILGVLALAIAGGAGGMAVVSRTTEERINYVDPNNVPAPWIDVRSERPYATIGVATAAGVTALALIEAVAYARRSQRGAALISRRGGSGATSAPSRGLSLSPTVDWRGGVGVRVGTTF
jgi:hypothetical protein